MSFDFFFSTFIQNCTLICFWAVNNARVRSEQCYLSQLFHLLLDGDAYRQRLISDVNKYFPFTKGGCT